MTATAGPSKGPDTWKPTRYLEPNKPDNEEVLEQAAYQAAITRQPGERQKRYKPRKTVDFMGGVLKWRQVSVLADRYVHALSADGKNAWTRRTYACYTPKSIRPYRCKYRCLLNEGMPKLMIATSCLCASLESIHIYMRSLCAYLHQQRAFAHSCGQGAVLPPLQGQADVSGLQMLDAC